jgi:NAD(P)H dehydrogenase (quinone)
VQWTALRNNFYSEFLKDLVGLMLVNGKLFIPEGTSKHSWVTREDCARAAAGALVGKLADIGPVDVTGPEALSFADLVPYLSRISGHPVTAQVSPESEITAQIAAKGVPAEAAGFMAGFASWVAHEMATTPTDTVERASGSKPVPVDVVLRTLP